MRLKPSVVRAGVEAILRDKAKGVYYVAECRGGVTGQLLITHEWSDWRNGNFWWIQSVYVKKRYRGLGIFKALFGHIAAAAAREGNVCGLRLYMERNNETAREVYRRLGINQTHYQVFERIFKR